MIGLPEIIVLVVIVLLVVCYKRLPQLGRSAGEGLRSLDRQGARALEHGRREGRRQGRSAGIGRSAGRSLREVREVRDAFTGKETAKDDEAAK